MRANLGDDRDRAAGRVGVHGGHRGRSGARDDGFRHYIIILFAFTLFRELWRDADKDKANEAFKEEVRENISGLKRDVSALNGDVREIKDMLKSGAPHRQALATSDPP